MGVAQSQDELNHVIELARTIPDVKRVVSYVKFAGRDNELNDAAYEPVPPQGPAAQPVSIDSEPVYNSSGENAYSNDYGSPTSLRPEDNMQPSYNDGAIESEELPSSGY